jgi:uncharacterized protein YegP (UPF0339 family)
MSNGIEFFDGDDGQHYFRVKAANGKTIAMSEGYKTEAGAQNGAEALAKAVLADVPEAVAEEITIETRPEDLDAFAAQYGELLHPTAVPSSATVIGKDRQTLRELLETAAEDGWTITPPAPEEDTETT